MQITTSILATALLLGQASELPPPSERGYAHIDRAVVYLIDEVKLPARQAGVIESLKLEDGTRVREGVTVQKGMILGTLDDRDAMARQQAAELDYRVAQAEHEKSSVAIEAAVKTSEVAHEEHQESLRVNARVPDTIPATQVRRQELTEKRAQAEVRVAESDEQTAGLTVELRNAQLEVAKINLENHHLVSPLDGEILTVQVQEGEWVGPGDPILSIVRLDKLRVAGYLSLKDFTREEVEGAEVAIEVRLKNRTERLNSTISYVSPVIDSDGSYRVWCEVENKPRNGRWPILPGMEAQMSIRLNR